MWSGDLPGSGSLDIGGFPVMLDGQRELADAGSAVWALVVPCLDRIGLSLVEQDPQQRPGLDFSTTCLMRAADNPTPEP
jgi:hypothetical protein